jgi:hypothetical protein
MHAILDKDSQLDFVLKLEELSEKYLFNQFHYALLNSNIYTLNREKIKNNIRKFE